MSLAPGTRLGRYEVLAPIGAGGMGEVHRARDLMLGREVALKVLAGTRGLDPKKDAQFEREAKVIAALSHPSILSVFDFGTEGQTAYLVTELLSGQTLRHLLATGTLGVERVMAIALDICEGLSAAHQKGIVHRDIKPANIFLTTEGRVKILDFGIAREATVTAESRDPTVTFSVEGTPSYMAPEQVRAERPRAQSDIFSLGCVLFETLTGAPPFERPTAAETMTAILREPVPDMRASAPSVPEPLVYVVERCLEKDWRARFQSAHDLALALRAVGVTPPTHRPPPPIPTKPRGPRGPMGALKSLALAFAAIVLLGVALTYVRRPGAPPATPSATASLAVLPFVNATSDETLDYLGAGLSEMIINRLSPLSGLRVLTLGSVAAMRGEVVPRDAAARLNVGSLVTGRITREADAILVSVSLVDGADGHQIWGERYRRTLAEMRGLEEEIGAAVSAKLAVELTGRDREHLASHRQPDPEAYRLYLQGRYEMDKRVPERMRKGIEDLDAAIAADPAYALPHLGLAHAYLLFGGMNEIVKPEQAMPMARAAAKKALALDPALAEAHAVLGAVAQQYDRSWPEAEREFQEALRLDDRDAIVHQWYGMALSYRERTDDAMRELRRTVELDPLSLVARADVAQILWMARRHDESISVARSLVDVEPRFWLGHLLVGLPTAAKGDLEAAIPSLEKSVALNGSAAAAGSLGWAYAKVGRRDDALGLRDKLLAAQRQRHVSETPFVLIGLGLGELDGVLASLEEACRQRSTLITVLGRTFFADAIRDDPRFARYLDIERPCEGVTRRGM